jgi:hypothetical protein
MEKHVVEIGQKFPYFRGLASGKAGNRGVGWEGARGGGGGGASATVATDLE